MFLQARIHYHMSSQFEIQVPGKNGFASAGGTFDVIFMSGQNLQNICRSQHEVDKQVQGNIRLVMSTYGTQS